MNTSPHSKKNKRLVGSVYENFIADYLRKKGAKILEMNYTSSPNEIDIIALEKGTVVFVEVKAEAASPTGHATPESQVNGEKMESLIRAAGKYVRTLKDKGIETDELDFRFDLAAVVFDANRSPKTCKYYKNYFTLKDTNEIF